jgi:hypothetical protein
MKTLTVCQPWAWAIVHGLKRVENRSWATHYRGPILIHAGKSRLPAELPEAPDNLVYGAVLGGVDIVDCVPVDDIHDNRFAVGPWCWVLGRPWRLRQPIAAKGRLSLYDLNLTTAQLRRAVK